MTEQQVQEMIDLDQDDKEYFAKYLGLDYDDYRSLSNDSDIDFDDWSR